MFANIRIIRDRAITAYPSGNDSSASYDRRCDNCPARNGILLRPETDASDGNLTCRFVPRRIALCPTTLEVREPIIFDAWGTSEEWDARPPASADEWLYGMVHRMKGRIR